MRQWPQTLSKDLEYGILLLIAFFCPETRMTNRPFALNLTVLTTMILVVALSRLIPHPPNFSPVEAMALFGGTYFARKSLAILVPLIALFISDLALGVMMGGEYFSYFTSAGFWLVYLTIAGLTVLGFGLRQRVTFTRVTMFSVLSALIFFLVTNFGVWWGASFYPQTMAGLMAAYAAGLPFLQNGLLGTLFYSAMLFGGYALIKSRLPNAGQQHA
jgi:hypothetical protein